MPRSKYQQRKIKDREEKALRLYKEGLSLRNVGVAVNRSHEWVRKVVDKLDREEVDKS